ncbi:DUF4915 domain-containing protein [Psychrobium sp. 1_MG-2023]|uniref:DUF4915 domain-containing protein n=1 Tax=Psychrobium sp. 1_MG-2023 TaxID=3062624 RepID=UPI000C345F9E|nr:DUF4915 domain-containing protein [Psychrobium sp. 1_MG-2023]MDP2559854.1 DUF4915 domain-containing protein [Psychrobium sp. 1_MG-2023]PKF59163.1 hypothetical protein CW748_02315 [Alteromonadales bacterium alter-6D02]
MSLKNTATWWKTWNEVNQLTSNREVVLYGRSEDWIPKTLKKLRNKPSYIIDRNPKYIDTDYKGLSVYLPERLLSIKSALPFVVITSGVYEGIVEILINNGFQPGIDFCCCPEYRDFQLLEDMRNYTQQLIVSCSDYNDKDKSRYSKAGGGIFLYHIGPNTYEKKISGSFRQIVKVKNLFYAIEYVACELFIFDSDFNIIETKPLDDANYCGLEYSEKHDLLILINAGKDTISLYDRETFTLQLRRFFSAKSESGETSLHHLNDVCCYDDQLYVSYFSHSGNWKKGIYDGGVSEFNLLDIEQPPVRLVRDLWKPHSPKIINGDLCYLDSMRGRFYTTNQVIAGEFHGFARGLASDDNFFYIGLSEDMYMSRRFGTTNNIMLNAGFYLFDKETKASRFYPMLDNMNIHDLHVLSKPEINA